MQNNSEREPTRLLLWNH